MEFHEKLKRMGNWVPGDDYRKVATIDAHTEGEPLRVIIGGFPELQGETILSRRRFARQHCDHLRTALMWEPRGHADMYGCLLTPPVSLEADFGVLFLHNEGFSTMCGHGIIAVTKVVLETGFLPMQEPLTTVKIDTPAGLVTALAKIENHSVQNVCFQNVPSFVLALDATVDVPGLGKINYDLAFGGAFYAFVQAEDVGLACTPAHYRQLIETGMQIKRAVVKSGEIVHPFEKDLNFLYGTIFIGPPVSKHAHSRNVCVFAEGEVDRSPTGTGVSARLAIHYARGDIRVDEPLIIESILGTKFLGRVKKVTTFGRHSAVVPEVEGSAYITGKNEFYIHPKDALKAGFILR